MENIKVIQQEVNTILHACSSAVFFARCCDFWSQDRIQQVCFSFFSIFLTLCFSFLLMPLFFSPFVFQFLKPLCVLLLVYYSLSLSFVKLFDFFFFFIYIYIIYVLPTLIYIDIYICLISILNIRNESCQFIFPPFLFNLHTFFFSPFLFNLYGCLFYFLLSTPFPPMSFTFKYFNPLFCFSLILLYFLLGFPPK